jgi:hypothetical protein
MIVKFLEWLIDLLTSRSKKPRLRLVINGIQEDGLVRFDSNWNKALIKNLNVNGFYAENEEETIQDFLLGSLIYPKELEDEVNSEAHPNLSSAENNFKRG